MDLLCDVIFQWEPEREPIGQIFRMSFFDICILTLVSVVLARLVFDQQQPRTEEDGDDHYEEYKERMRLMSHHTQRLEDHYIVLDINPEASHEEIVKAAKLMRIKSHPDRLKKQKGLSEEQMENIDRKAALVGQAADVLCDPISRYQYNLQRVEGI